MMEAGLDPHADFGGADHATEAPDVLRTIRAGLVPLSEGQKRIAELILDQPQWALTSNVEDIAQAAQVSAPTIVRFCRAVGCEGLKDFKLKLAAALARGDALRCARWRQARAAAAGFCRRR